MEGFWTIFWGLENENVSLQQKKFDATKGNIFEAIAPFLRKGMKKKDV